MSRSRNSRKGWKRGRDKYCLCPRCCYRPENRLTLRADARGLAEAPRERLCYRVGSDQPRGEYWGGEVWA